MTGCDEFFTERVARRDASRYRRRGLDGNAQRLVDVVRREGIRDRTVLEVGGGVGAIQLELLRAGAAGTTNAELSAAYEGPAAELADEAGLVGRTERRLLDFASSGGDHRRCAGSRPRAGEQPQGGLLGARRSHTQRAYHERGQRMTHRAEADRSRESSRLDVQKRR